MEGLNDQSQFICFKMGKVQRSIQRYYDTNLLPYGLTAVQFLVIGALSENEGVKFKDLASVLAIEGSTLTGILDRMERRGFVERKDDPGDRRSVLVFLTEKGRQIGPEAIGLVRKLDHSLREQFSQEQFAQFLNVLDQIVVPD